jgi:glycine dehydrogenase subunit 2
MTSESRWCSELQESLFTKSREGVSGYKLPSWTGAPVTINLPEVSLRQNECDLPSISEPEVMRHFTALSTLNHHIERGMYPLGSCTMKYNPRMNEQVAALPGFSSLHPEQDVEDIQGMLEALYILQDMLCEITGFSDCCLQPAAGAHGEFLGMQVIRAFHLANGDYNRVEVLIPDSAHGTNPASVVVAGMKPVTIKSGDDGRIDLEVLRAACNENTAGIMITNPSTLGLFEKDIVEISKIIHEAGGRLYMDGANMNAIMGKSRPAEMGFDVIHLNLHKTFSTPHGGGGPGSGPICVTAELAPFLPAPIIVEDDGQFDLAGYQEQRPSVHPYFGNVGICIRALTYILRCGGNGLTRVSEIAVLNANYIKAELEGILDIDHSEGCLHEFVATGKHWKEKFGVRTLDVAKRLLDYGVHAPTVYFPLIVDEALMIEPTETESLESLKLFIAAIKSIREEAENNPELLHNAPVSTPVGRMDETKAARQPDLSWMGPCNCG